MSQLRKAERRKAKIRLGLSAVSGGGKTMSALLIAYGITDNWEKIAVVDTENNSADLYDHLGPYNVYPLGAPYNPERYIEAINICEAAGMEVIIVDSITHEWDGKGGCLEIIDSLGGSYQKWAAVTPRHQAFIDKIVSSSCHIITTVRRKQDYDVIKDDKGKVKVEKAGLKEVTREGFEYELTTNLELDIRHNATASKDRTRLFMGQPAFTPTVETGKLIRQWCEMGEDALPAIPAEQQPIRTKTVITQKQFEQAAERIQKNDEYSQGVYDNTVKYFDLSKEQLDTLLGLLNTNAQKKTA